MKTFLLFSLFGIILMCGSQNINTDPYSIPEADVIVYGGTSAAVTTAVKVARMGRSVIIVSPDKHLGGFSSSGLGFTDTGNPSSGLLPRISSEVPGENGSGDNKIQAYCFRLCLTRNPEGFVQNEGDSGVRPEKPYQIDLGSLMPKKEECSNLLVPVCISCSHIAFGSIRMEPVFMILGQSAGTIAAMALEKRSSIYKLVYEEIKSKLESEGSDT